MQKQSQSVNRISYKGHSYELELYTAHGLLKKFFLGTARLRVDRHGFSLTQLAYKRLDSRSYRDWLFCNHLTNCSVIKRFSVKQISRLLLTLIFSPRMLFQPSLILRIIHNWSTTYFFILHSFKQKKLSIVLSSVLSMFVKPAHWRPGNVLFSSVSKLRVFMKMTLELITIIHFKT